MSKAPDLSAFPIPRKGGARPIDPDEEIAPAASSAPRGQEGAEAPAPAPTVVSAAEDATSVSKKPEPLQHPVAGQTSGPTQYGQTVATTVKLDENRYLRLSDAGRPGPGRLKRRTIQEIMVEALDEWFERRGV